MAEIHAPLRFCFPLAAKWDVAYRLSAEIADGHVRYDAVPCHAKRRGVPPPQRGRHQAATPLRQGRFRKKRKRRNATIPSENPSENAKQSKAVTSRGVAALDQTLPRRPPPRRVYTRPVLPSKRTHAGSQIEAALGQIQTIQHVSGGSSFPRKQPFWRPFPHGGRFHVAESCQRDVPKSGRRW